MSETKGYTQTISTAEFSETPLVALEQPTGDVYIEAWDRPEIEVSISEPDALFEATQHGSEVTIHNRPGSFKFANFIEPAAAELESLGIGLDKIATRVERKVERGMRRLNRKGIGVNIDLGQLGRWSSGRTYNIKVPYNCNLRMRTSSGDLAVMGVNGTLFLQSTSGDIRVQRVAGNVLVNSSSGDIRMEALEGKLGARTASGDINVKQASLHEISVSTVSGDLSLDLRRVPDRDWDVKTVSGDLTVTIPREERVIVQTHTLSGEVNCGFPREQVNYSAGRGRESTLVINGGGSTIHLHTVSGDISIRPGSMEQKTGSHTTDLSRAALPAGSTAGEAGDIMQAEGYAVRQQAELEILQALERGEINAQEAMRRLGELGG